MSWQVSDKNIYIMQLLDFKQKTLINQKYFRNINNNT